MNGTLPKPPKKPCGSCPYRLDTPSGIWEEHEYRKLPHYDGNTGQQFMNGATALFMCHQKDGCLCGGWLVTHDPNHLAALRLNAVHQSAFSYDPGVPCHPSGEAACAHGLRDAEEPSPDARKMIAGLIKKRSK